MLPSCPVAEAEWRVVVAEMVAGRARSAVAVELVGNLASMARDSEEVTVAVQVGMEVTAMGMVAARVTAMGVVAKAAVVMVEGKGVVERAALMADHLAVVVAGLAALVRRVGWAVQVVAAVAPVAILVVQGEVAAVS